MTISRNTNDNVAMAGDERVFSFDLHYSNRWILLLFFYFQSLFESSYSMRDREYFIKIRNVGLGEDLSYLELGIQGHVCGFCVRIDGVCSVI